MRSRRKRGPCRSHSHRADTCSPRKSREVETSRNGPSRGRQPRPARRSRSARQRALAIPLSRERRREDDHDRGWIADHIGVLHADAGALTQRLMALLFAVETSDAERGVALRVHEFASDGALANTRDRRLLRNLIERYPIPPDGGSCLRVVVSHAATQATACVRSAARYLCRLRGRLCMTKVGLSLAVLSSAFGCTDCRFPMPANRRWSNVEIQGRLEVLFSLQSGPANALGNIRQKSRSV